jgi:hypothetical protein
MNKVILIVFIVFTGINGFSGPKNLQDQTRELILKTLTYTDVNEMHRPVTDSIVHNFQRALLNRDIHNLSDSYTKQISEYFKQIYDNGFCIYEDSPDYRRMKIRRAISFASIAVVSDYKKAYTFIEFAQLALIEDVKTPYSELIEQQLLGLQLLDLLMRLEENIADEISIQSVEKYLKSNRESFDFSVYIETYDLLNQYKKLIK